jgi:hypothetical protein
VNLLEIISMRGRIFSGIVEVFEQPCQAGEVKRVAASIYGLGAIASELRDLAETMNSPVASS